METTKKLEKTVEERWRLFGIESVAYREDYQGNKEEDFQGGKMVGLHSDYSSLLRECNEAGEFNIDLFSLTHGDKSHYLRGYFERHNIRTGAIKRVLFNKVEDNHYDYKEGISLYGGTVMALTFTVYVTLGKPTFLQVRTVYSPSEEHE